MQIWKPLLFFCAVMIVSPLAGDTVYLKSGGKILDCRIDRKDNRLTYLRTPSGRMGVPTEIIERIEPGKSTFDAYDEKRKAVSDKDSSGLFRLALWCRETCGLRQEMAEILERVVSLSPNHVQARHFLGHARTGDRWKPLPPLSLQLEFDNGNGNGNGLDRTLKEQLAMVLNVRRDVRISPPNSDVEALNSCKLTCSMAAGGSRGSTIFGQGVRGASSWVDVTFKASAFWIGKSPATITLGGEAPGGVPDIKQQALMDALNREPLKFHAYLDSLVELRIKHFESTSSLPKAVRS